MNKWTHNATGGDYFELSNGPFAAENCRVNDYDFVVGVDTPDGMLVFPQDVFDMEKHRGATFYYGQVQAADPVEFGDVMRCYKSLADGKMWFRPLREWGARFTNFSDKNFPRAPDLSNWREEPEVLRVRLGQQDPR